MNINISKNIKYVGVNDNTIDLFENQYKVPNGISYNSYIIIDEKVAIMDTVDERKTNKWLHNVENILTKYKVKPKYLIVSHVEPDHSSSIPALLRKYPNIILVGNSQTFKFIEQFYNLNISENSKIIVKDGDTLSLGKHVLHFLSAPMVHWPEVQFTYEETEKVLFSADTFGKFGKIGSKENWTDEARRYYINIVGKYGIQVQNILKKVLKFDIKKICPLHGEILDSNLNKYINLYNNWSTYTPEKENVLIIYGCLHNNTEKVAIELNNILKEQGKKTKLINVMKHDFHDIIAKCFENKTIVFAASSYNTGVFPMMDFLLRQLVSKNFQNRRIAFIENGTWAPSATKTMKEILEPCKNLEYIEPNITIKSSANKETLIELKELANNL